MEAGEAINQNSAMNENPLMTIDEAKQKKAELAKAVTGLVREFQKATGMVVTFIGGAPVLFGSIRRFRKRGHRGQGRAISVNEKEGHVQPACADCKAKDWAIPH